MGQESELSGAFFFFSTNISWMYEAGLVRDFSPGAGGWGRRQSANAKVFKKCLFGVQCLPHMHVGLCGGGELGHEMGRRVCKNVLKLKFSSLQ